MTDLLALLSATRMPRRTLTRAEIRRRWKDRNRAKFNAYRRAWRQSKREQGIEPT